MGLKSVFDALYVDQLIQKSDDGRFTLYPHGMMGRGYQLPADAEPAMRGRVRTMMIVALFIGIAFGMFYVRVAEQGSALSLLAHLSAIGVGVLGFAGLIFYQRRLARGLEPAGERKPSAAEFLRGGRRTRPAWTYRFCIFLGSLLALMSIAALGVGASDGDVLVIVSGLVMLGVSVFAAWDGVLGLRERRAAM
jgi:hypothetical protein